MQLAVDDRERAVVPFLDKFSAEFKIDFTVQRQQIGDYAILYNGMIIAIIERKTWEDLAASMRDGRKENVQKLQHLQNLTSCRVIYLIEGDAYPAPSKKYGRVSVKGLRSHLDHLVFRDQIHVMYAKNQEQTALRLFELAQNISTIRGLGDIVGGMGGSNGKSKDKSKGKKSVDDDKNGGTEMAEGEKEETIESNAGLLNEKVESKVNISAMVLQCLPQVGALTATVMSDASITLSDIASGKVTVDSLAALKYPTGAKIGLVKAGKIIKSAVKALNDTDENKTQIKLLSAVPRVTAQIASTIIDGYLFSEILSGVVTADHLREVVKENGKMLGPVAAGNIVKYLAG